MFEDTRKGREMVKDLRLSLTEENLQGREEMEKNGTVNITMKTETSWVRSLMENYNKTITPSKTNQ